MTDVPDLVRVSVVAPIGNSDQSYLSAVISMAQAHPNLYEYLLLLVGRFVPTKVIRVRNKDKPSFDQCRHAFGFKQEAHFRWTRDGSRVNSEEFVYCQVRANETYSEAKRQFSVRNKDVFIII